MLRSGRDAGVDAIGVFHAGRTGVDLGACIEVRIRAASTIKAVIVQANASQVGSIRQ